MRGAAKTLRQRSTRPAKKTHHCLQESLWLRPGVVSGDPKTREQIVEIFKIQMRDKIEIEEVARGQRRRVNAGVDFRHAPVHVLVLGDPRTNDAYPMRTKLDKRRKRTISAAWRIASCRSFSPPRRWVSAICTSAMSPLPISASCSSASPEFGTRYRSIICCPSDL